YSFLGKHIEGEFTRLRGKNVGIVEAAWEADYIRESGLEHSPQTSRAKFHEAMSDVRVFGLEDENLCRAVTLRELETFEALWTVDSRLVHNVEGICGATGLDMPVSRVIERLSRTVVPPIPLPRVLGTSKRPFATRDITKIYISAEERSHRID